MDRLIKNALGIVSILFIAIATIAIGIVAYSFVKSGKTTSVGTFTVSGEGKVVAAPDIAQFTFSVITEGGTDIDTLQKENTDKTNRIIDFLKSKGVEKEDIKTASYDVGPRQQYFPCTGGSPCPPPKIVGYTVNQTVFVKVRKLEEAGELLGGVTANGANSVSGLSFTIDKPEKVENEARAKAISEAKEKAEVMAKAGGFRVGRLISIQEGGGFSPPIPLRAAPAMMESVDAKASPVIEPGSQEVIVNVTLQYEIK